MRLTLIGMSGSGKSYWSRKLAEQGFRRFCCDDLISAKLLAELRGPNGTTLELGEWMGFPYEPHYKEHESKYLACEIEILNEILEYLESPGDNPEENIIVDTTGSVIYTGENILQKLRRLSTVVLMSTPPEIQKQMLRAYVARQRPVLWKDMFNKEPDESNEEALARCYSGLLLARERLYERYAHVIIDYHRRHKEGFGVSDILHEVNLRES